MSTLDLEGPTLTSTNFRSEFLVPALLSEEHAGSTRPAKVVMHSGTAVVLFQRSQLIKVDGSTIEQVEILPLHKCPEVAVAGLLRDGTIYKRRILPSNFCPLAQSHALSSEGEVGRVM
jgi:hypothetical protein